MKIRFLFAKLFQIIMILSVAYAGSFLLVEETAEKAERAESEKEAIFHQFKSSKVTDTAKEENDHSTSYFSTLNVPQRDFSYKLTMGNYHVNWMYYTSFLDIS